MTFETVEKEFRLLKLEYINGISDDSNLRLMMNEVLIVTDEYNDRWKMDAETSRWLWHDSRRDEWLERERPGKDRLQGDIEFKIAIETPAPPQLPKQSVPHPVAMTKANSAETEEKAKAAKVISGPNHGKQRVQCAHCGSYVAPGDKTCIVCGRSILVQNKRCPSCGMEHKTGAKFCKNCGCSVERSSKGKCSNCGNVNKESTKFCIKCGSALK